MTYHDCCHLLHLSSRQIKDVSRLGSLPKILPLLCVEAITEKYMFSQQHPLSLYRLRDKQVAGLIYRHLM